jgi:hypothetical protein
MFEFLTLSAILEFGTVFFYGFWAVIMLLALVESTLVESEKFEFAFVMVLGLSCFFGWRFNFLALVHQRPMMLWKFVASYVVIGVIWMFVKWVVLVRRHRGQAEKILLAYKERHFIKNMAESDVHAAFEYDRHLEKPPKAGHNKGKLVSWAYLWPFSIVGTIVGDWLKEVFIWIYARLGGILDWVSSRVWGGKFEV